MPGQDAVDRGTEPHHAAAQIERCDLERQDAVVDGDVGRGTGRYGDI